MNIPPMIKKFTNTVLTKCSKDMGSMLIGTTVVGWVASSIAQIIGVATNSKYTTEQKSFMIPQEIGDAAINIGSFFLVTLPIKKLAGRLVRTGKIVPADIRAVLNSKNYSDKVGKLDFDVTKIKEFDNFEKHYNSFSNFMSTSAAVVGGIISSNIITPILRNRVAAKNQTQIKTTLNARENVKQNKQLKKSECYSAKSTFNNLRNNSLTI